jgi:acetoin utilization deacetylase AcuC-like enzyme
VIASTASCAKKVMSQANTLALSMAPGVHHAPKHRMRTRQRTT